MLDFMSSGYDHDRASSTGTAPVANGAQQVHSINANSVRRRMMTKTSIVSFMHKADRDEKWSMLLSYTVTTGAFSGQKQQSTAARIVMSDFARALNLPDMSSATLLV